MGLDGFAMCSRAEDLTFIDELNIDESAYRLPWFDQIRGSELNNLFGEKKDRVFPKKHKQRYSDIVSDNENDTSLFPQQKKAKKLE